MRHPLRAFSASPLFFAFRGGQFAFKPVARLCLFGTSLSGAMVGSLQPSPVIAEVTMTGTVFLLETGAVSQCRVLLIERDDVRLFGELRMELLEVPRAPWNQT